MKDFIIIGAGLSGLTTAFKIKQLKLGSSIILEKSRGVGGRLATRRTLNTRFDHGAQYYRSKVDILEFHQIWKENKISKYWFNSQDIDHWSSQEGMTNLAKFLSKDLEIELDKLINTIHFENNCWKVISDKNEIWIGNNLIISAPLPQAIALLDRAKIEYSDELKKIEYTKALIGLLTLEDDVEINKCGYLEFSEGNFFSISDQKRKGVSNIPAFTITMSAQFSEVEFDQPEHIILEKIIEHFKKEYPNAKIMGSELKKWRYCRPKSNFNQLSLEIAPKLFLIGDTFGGNSLLGAVRSAESIINFLKK